MSEYPDRTFAAEFAAASRTDSIRGLAGMMAGAFETARRETGEDESEPYVRLREGSPEWMSDVVRAAHDDGEMLPDDWRYSTIRSAVECIAESDDPEDAAHEWADAEVDVYTSARFAWLASNLRRAGYVDQAQDEGITEGSERIVSLIGLGQYNEAREIYSQVLEALGAVSDS